jgi:hypothetical protein
MKPFIYHYTIKFSELGADPNNSTQAFFINGFVYEEIILIKCLIVCMRNFFSKFRIKFELNKKLFEFIQAKIFDFAVAFTFTFIVKIKKVIVLATRLKKIKL